MPINAGPEYFKAEERYLSAKTREEKIDALEEMIRKLPKHKGTQTMLAQLKKRLANLKKESASRAKAKPKFAIRKEGAAQICILGLTNSGKSSLINALTNAKLKTGDYPHTTKLPEVGMMNYEGVLVQLVEIPSSFTPDIMAVVRTCDMVLFLLDCTADLDEQLEKLSDVMEKSGLDTKEILIVGNKSDENTIENILQVSAKTSEGLPRMKEEIWRRLHLIRIYTKSPNGKAATKPLTLPTGSTVEDAVRQVHKAMLKNFRFARIFDNTKFSGRKVGLEYVLKDKDILEIHAG
jgi:small GTP-binding protein